MFQFLWEEKSHRLSTSGSPTSFFNTEVEQSLCHTNQTSHHPARNQPRLHTRSSLEQQIHTTWSSPKTKMAYCALYSYSPVTQVFFLQCKNCELCSVSSSEVFPPCLSQISAHKVTFPNTLFMATQSTERTQSLSSYHPFATLNFGLFATSPLGWYLFVALFCFCFRDLL